MPLPVDPLSRESAAAIVALADRHGLAGVLDALVTHYAAMIGRRDDWDPATRAEALKVLYDVARACGTMERSTNPHITGL
jgi:hypothetical protein